MSNNLTKDQIKQLLPHREPMLLLDQLVDIKKLHSGRAIVNVTKESFFVQGHFPGQPVMPGDRIKMTGELICPVAIEQGMRFAIREGGRTIGAGVVSKILK